MVRPLLAPVRFGLACVSLRQLCSLRLPGHSRSRRIDPPPSGGGPGPRSRRGPWARDGWRRPWPTRFGLTRKASTALLGLFALSRDTQRFFMRDDEDDEVFRRLIADWDQRLAEADETLDAAAPSDAVWDRISARIDQLQARRDTLTVPADQGAWEATSPGVWRKQLHVDAGGGWRAMLVRIDPGATLPAHRHSILEECLVLEGAFDLAGETIRKGDFHLGFPGREHRVITSRGGALLYIRAAADR